MYKYIKILSLIYISLSSLVFLSLNIFLFSIVSSSELTRFLVIDSFLTLFVFLQFKILKSDFSILFKKPSFKHFIFLYAGLIPLISLFIGLMTNDLINVFKEARLYYYFYITLLIWTCSSSTKNSSQNPLILNLSKENLVLIILSFSVVGNMLHILFSNLFLPDIPILDQGLEGALGASINKKFIVTPYVIAFTQSYSILVILSEKKLFSLKYLMSFLLFGASSYAAFFSNVRAGILAWIIGGVVSIIYVFLSKSTKNLSRVYVRLFIFLVIVCISMYFLINYLAAEYPRFTEQIFEKDPTLNFTGRSDILLDTFFSFNVISIYGFFGRGFGASIPLAAWRNNFGELGNYGNPIDSTFLNISVSFGYPFLIVYICLLITILINMLKYIRSVEGSLKIQKKALNIHIPLIASFLSLLLNNFSTSAFLLVSNSIITGVLFGYTLSLSSDIERSK